MPTQPAPKKTKTRSPARRAGKSAVKSGDVAAAAREARNAKQRANRAQRRAEFAARELKNWLERRFETLRGVRQGNRDDLKLYEEFLDEHPEFRSRVPELDTPSQRAERQAIARLANGDLLAIKTYTAAMDTLRQSLLPPDPTPLDHLLVSNVVVAHLDEVHIGLLPVPKDLQQLKLHEKRVEAARKRFVVTRKEYRDHRARTDAPAGAPSPTRRKPAFRPRRSLPPDAAAEVH